MTDDIKDDGTCRTCTHKTCMQRRTSSKAYTVCNNRPDPSLPQPKAKECVCIPKDLLEDIKIYLQCGCDGTLPNTNELLDAIGKYSHVYTTETTHCNHAMNVIECECWKWCNKTETCPHLNEAGKSEARKYRKPDPTMTVFFFGIPILVSPDMISKAAQLEKAIRDHDDNLKKNLLTKILGLPKPAFSQSLEESGWNYLMSKIADMKQELDAGEKS